MQEKRTRMLDWFHETQSFYQLKDVEKICSTEKGITLNTCKDVLIALTEDGLVDSEKIGTSLYYWSLPSKALATKAEQLKQMEAELVKANERNKLLHEQIETKREEQDTRVNDEEKRNELKQSIEELSKMRAGLMAELAAYQENDPGKVNQWREEIILSKTACNRWIENIFSLKSWMKNKFRCEERMLDKQFEIPDDLDYIN